MKPEYSQKYLQLNRQRGVVYDVGETPFTSVSPDASVLDGNPFLKLRAQQSFPRLEIGKASVVDGAIVIQDTTPSPLVSAQLRDLNIISNITLQIIEAQELNLNLLSLLRGSLNDKPLVVFPGEGAKTLYESLNEDLPEAQSVFLPTKRTFIEPGRFDLSVDFTSLPPAIPGKKVVILDDVIATGQTISTIGQEIKTRFPGTEVYAGAWVMVEPRATTTSSGINNVDKAFTSLLVRGNYVKQPPINSLSCLIRSGGKYDVVKSNFIEKYIRDETIFTETLARIGGEIK